ncbi:MAG: hypothetical protein ACLR7U_06385 [Ruthenibacterium lactatiformans]
MPIEFDASLEFDSASLILERHGLALGGPAQTFVDSEVIRYCDPKVPFETGMLKDSAGGVRYRAGNHSTTRHTPDGCTITSVYFNEAPERGAYCLNGPWQSIRRISSAEFRLS